MIRLIASNTHPIGIAIESFPDDVDPISFSPINIKEMQMDLNGNPVSWAVGAVIPVNISVIPGSDDDEQLYVLFNANRASGFMSPKRDEITLTISYPDNSMKIFSKGRIISGTPSIGAAASGRMTTKTYGFAFADMTNISVKSFLYSAFGLLTGR